MDVIELRMMTNASARSGEEVGRVTLPVALLQKSGAELGVVDIWAPAPPPPPMLHVSMHRAANDAFGGISVRLRQAFALPNDLGGGAGGCNRQLQADKRSGSDGVGGERTSAGAVAASARSTHSSRQRRGRVQPAAASGQAQRQRQRRRQRQHRGATAMAPAPVPVPVQSAPALTLQTNSDL